MPPGHGHDLEAVELRAQRVHDRRHGHVGVGADDEQRGHLEQSQSGGGCESSPSAVTTAACE